MQILDGKETAAEFRASCKETIKERVLKLELAVITVGNDPASEVYVRNKKKACIEAGISFNHKVFDNATTTHEIVDYIETLNEDSNVTGILVQLPLPNHINEEVVLKAIDWKKDVDGFHPLNVGRLSQDKWCLEPCTPLGIEVLLDKYDIEVEGKHCVIIGRSNIVGKPMAMVMLSLDATVTVCHSHTHNLKDICKQADILIVAIGQAKKINKEYIKPGAVVIDVGMDRDENGKLCGDVDFQDVKDVVSYITPVPGGVGPMTVAGLLNNVIYADTIQKSF